MTISPQGQLYKFATEYAFDPSRASTKTPKLNVPEKIPFSMTGVDLTTGKRVDLAAPKEEKDQGSVFGKESPLPPWQQAMEWNPFLDYQREKNLAYQQAVSNLEAQQQLGLMKELSPLIYDATKKAAERDLYYKLAYQKYSPKELQARMQSAQAGETSMAQAFGYQTGNAANLAAATAPRKHGR